jgi:hypothetical protein
MNNCQVKVRQCRTPVPTVWQFCWLMGIAWIGVFLIGCSNPALDSRSRERAKEQPARGTEEDLEVLQRGAPLADVKAKLKLTVDLDYIMAFSTAIQEYAKHYRTSMFPDWTFVITEPAYKDAVVLDWEIVDGSGAIVRADPARKATPVPE